MAAEEELVDYEEEEAPAGGAVKGEQVRCIKCAWLIRQ